MARAAHKRLTGHAIEDAAFTRHKGDLPPVYRNHTYDRLILPTQEKLVRHLLIAALELEPGEHCTGFVDPVAWGNFLKYLRIIALYEHLQGVPPEERRWFTPSRDSQGRRVLFRNFPDRVLSLAPN